MRGTMICTGFMLALTGAPAAMAQSPMTAPPPPQLTTVRSPPPIFMRESANVRSDIPVTATMIRVTLGGKILWSGPLNIGGGGQARISLSEPVTRAETCDRTTNMGASRQIELTINTQSYRPTPSPEYRLSLRYSRPSDEGDCPVGLRTIAIEQGFSLGGSKSFAFEGDGGLKVQIALQ